VTVYCFDTDALSNTLWQRPPVELTRRLAHISPDDQATTTITVGEMLYGAKKRGNVRLAQRIKDVTFAGLHVLPFDEPAARTYADVRVELERQGRRLDEPDTRIAAIALSRDLTLITGNVRHFARVPDLRVENWLEPG